MSNQQGTNKHVKKDRMIGIAIGCDHAGYELKEQLKTYLTKKRFYVIDMGTDGPDSVDYPDFVHPVAEKVSNKEAEFGILICGSGNGVTMTANKHKKIRAALCWNVELAKLAVEHNNANVLSLPSKFISQRQAVYIVSAFLSAKFEGGRHERRVKKMTKF